MVVDQDVQLSLVCKVGVVVESPCILHADYGVQVSLMIQVAVAVEKIDYNDVHDAAQVHLVEMAIYCVVLIFRSCFLLEINLIFSRYASLPMCTDVFSLCSQLA